MKKTLIAVMGLLILALDLFTKQLTESILNLGESITVIPGFFEIEYARNTGAAWSLLGNMNSRPFFLILSLSVSIYIFLKFIKEDNTLLLFAFSLVLAGNMGNFYDRLKLHYVRDMLSFNLFGYPYPIFNVADISLVIGFGLLMIYIYLDEKGKINGQD